MEAKRGRKNKYELNTPKFLEVVPRVSLEAPRDLTEAQMEIWNQLMVSNNTEIFDAHNYSVLVSYVRLVDYGNKLAKEVDAAFEKDINDEKNLRNLGQVLRHHNEYAKSLIAHATKLRLTPSSYMTSKQAHRILDKARDASETVLDPLVRPVAID